MKSSSKQIFETSTPFSTRLATAEDIDALVEVGRKTFSDTFAEANTEEDMSIYIEKTFTEDQVRKEISDPASTFILAEDAGIVIGYAKLREGNNPPELTGTNGIEIERIYAVKNYLGKNVGKALMQTCIELARLRGYQVVWLGVWEHNPRAIAFYEKWGFKKFGSHPFLLGNDLQTDLLMKMPLKQV
ncbi:GNAT family N-acetyltransferase [Chryseolinea sp. H1M3-3]|jgi:diamine N-acetyltransferase|uniref:GNAT family N-acetyltransferase n=1 Tax=Chryseolinea sp. H1M3-3 TaxID=3034144 RepID=UPI0023ECFA12|nr:GNAT family N-acetyltransferase [Chryseolinea sp. H1M3-3]